MKYLYLIALIGAIISLIFAVIERIFGWHIFGYMPSSFLKFTDTCLLFAILFVLVWWMKMKED